MCGIEHGARTKSFWKRRKEWSLSAPPSQSQGLLSLMQFYLLNPGSLGELSYFAKGNRPGEVLPSSSQYGRRNIPGITAIWGTECHSAIPQLLTEHLLWARHYCRIRKMGKLLCQQGARDLTSNTVGEMKLSSGSDVLSPGCPSESPRKL